MWQYRLGDVAHDLSARTLVMGILNRTPDSFYDAGETFELDALLRRAEQLVDQGADLLDIGGVKAGPGPEVGEAEELDRVVPSIEAVRARFDVPISSTPGGRRCSTPRARPARSSATTSAASATPSTSRSRPKHDASVVATHIRLAAPRAGPRAALRRPRRRRPRLPRRPGAGGRSAPASRPSRSRSTPGSTSARRRRMSAVLLRESDALADARLHAAALGLEQAVPRRPARARHRRPPRGRRSPRSRTASPTAAASSGCTTSPDRSGSAGWSRRSSNGPDPEPVPRRGAGEGRGDPSRAAGERDPARRGAPAAARRPPGRRRPHARARGVHRPREGRAPTASDDVPGGAEGAGRGDRRGRSTRLQSPPFMTTGAIVVRPRGSASSPRTSRRPSSQYLGEPAPTTALRVRRRRRPARRRASLDALKAAKAVDVGPESEKTGDVLDAARSREAGLTLDADGKRAVAAHLGDDAGRVPQLVERARVRRSAPGATLGVDDVEPYLGEPAGPRATS